MTPAPTIRTAPAPRHAPGPDGARLGRPRASSCSPAACRTSATSRCAPGAGSRRRCAGPASRSRCTTSTPTSSRRSPQTRPDLVWPLLHGATGEDGSVRDVLELLGLRYLGTDPRASRVAWSKPVAKTIVGRRRAWRRRRSSRCRRASSASSAPPGCSTPSSTGSASRSSSSRRAAARRSGSTSSGSRPSCPRDGGRVRLRRHRAASSGRSRVASSRSASSTVRTGCARCPAVEIVTDGPYDYDARYNPGRTEYFTPGPPDRRRGSGRGDVAVGAHEALGPAPPVPHRPHPRRRRRRAVPRGQRGAGDDGDVTASRRPRRRAGTTSASMYRGLVELALGGTGPLAR